MPFDTNSGKLGPIEVFEDNTHFLIRIHPGNRDRAKKINGRQWDGNRKAWVYPKDPPTYEALVEEFQDADRFEIQQPKLKRPPKTQPLEETDNDFEAQILAEVRSLSGIDESQDKIHRELEDIREMLGSLKDVAANQNRLLEEVRGTQEAAVVLTKFEPDPQQSVNPEQVEIEVLPDSLDLTKHREIELLEKALITIACCTAKGQRSFCEWVSSYQPLKKPSGFVIKTHEFLKKQLGKLVGDEDPHAKFISLVKRARDENLIYRDQKNPADKPISILFTLNEHRNCFGHPNFDQWEEWSRSILYLMNLALVWSKVAIDEENSED